MQAHKARAVLTICVQTMDQFRNFKRFIDKVDKYGMKSGIVKVVPPTEWYISISATSVI